jgi:hypothetical protein
MYDLLREKTTTDAGQLGWLSYMHVCMLVQLNRNVRRDFAGLF